MLIILVETFAQIYNIKNGKQCKKFQAKKIHLKLQLKIQLKFNIIINNKLKSRTDKKIMDYKCIDEFN